MHLFAFSADTIQSSITTIPIPITLPIARYYYWRALVKDNFSNVAKSVPDSVLFASINNLIYRTNILTEYSYKFVFDLYLN